MEHGGQTLKQIGDLAAGAGRSTEKVKAIAEIIRSACGYRWAGIYEVTSTEIAAIGWTGTEGIVPDIPNQDRRLRTGRAGRIRAGAAQGRA